MPRRSQAETQQRISVIIPTLNEERWIGPRLRELQGSSVLEVIVVDGGSADATVRVAESLGARVLRERANRGLQQNRGAEEATGEILLFLHADTSLPRDFADQVRATLRRPGVSAGAFRFRLDGPGWRLRLVERVVALRCQIFRLPYGDQAIFLQREVFQASGRFAAMPVMEDFDLIRRLKKLGRVALAEGAVVTSARRWRREGVWRVTCAHQICILGYYLRMPPNRLARLRDTAFR